MAAEPQLEDLSAYLDQELTGTARQDLEAHLGTCETCRRRLAALRQTVSAVQGLPTEVPPRVFTIPPQRQQRTGAPGWAWAAPWRRLAC
jgi:anti-sigma factor RsiW